MNYQKGLTGVFGDPVADNPSVVIEQAAFDSLDIPMQYLTIQVKKGELETAIEGMRAMNFAGINITMPHKIEVLKYLDEIAEDARIMGAVNTVYSKEGKLFGENTDGKGFIMNLRTGNVPIESKNAVILGAGGVARAIAVELANSGINKITIVNIIQKDGKELVDLLNTKTQTWSSFVMWDGKYEIPEDTDIVVNATSIGFTDPTEKPPINYESLKANMAVCDVIPNKFRTLFLEEAEKRGCKTFNGMQMLVNQGAIAFELWTKQKAPVDVMLKALKEAYAQTDSKEFE